VWGLGVCECEWSILSECEGLLFPWRLLSRSPVVCMKQAVYSQNRDGYGVEGCGRGQGGSEVRAWWRRGGSVIACQGVVKVRG